ncbi:hypothetical protein BSIN_2938 [Burkholderia singularis]|uniref:Uncharacterized protein n=1 Tax=Burkholderia singularis TaxID=1503053 RepID=A0A238H3E6_9BURK|nr:hypothetical protein BSIN_2938 [Burkholderia singularis]
MAVRLPAHGACVSMLDLALHGRPRGENGVNPPPVSASKGRVE